MNAMVTPRGGQAVGHLAELDGLEAAAVNSLRRWYDGPDTRAELCADILGALGERGIATLEAMDALFGLCAKYARRPMMRHHLECTCFGGDEACFASLMAFAAEGARDDAMLLAVHMVRADQATMLVGLAETVALSLRAASGERVVCRPSGAVLH